MITVETATELRALLKRYIDAQAASTRAQEARARLQAGSTRARSTTANANWARAAEHRDRRGRSVDGVDFEKGTQRGRAVHGIAGRSADALEQGHGGGLYRQVRGKKHRWVSGGPRLARQ
mgnify:CR=1 FL=1